MGELSHMGKNYLERCLVVPRTELFGADDGHCFDGYRPLRAWRDDLHSIIAGSGSFIRRHSLPLLKGAEDDSTYKQIIPCGIVRYEDQFFHIKRLAGGSEKRLVGRSDVAFAGHAEPRDASVGIGGVLERCLLREFHEELSYAGHFDMRPLGYVNEEASMVGKVHFGVVYLIDIHHPKISISPKEVKKHSGSLIPIAQGAHVEPAFNTWQQMMYDALSVQKCEK